MYAVIEDKGHQYKVAEGERIQVDLREVKPGDVIEFDRVLYWSDDTTRQVGAPVLAGAKVRGEVLSEFKAKKITSYKYSRRETWHKKIGHRQRYLDVRITEILAPSAVQE